MSGAARPCTLPTPSGWRELRWHPDAKAWATPGGLRVLASIDEISGAEWLHISISRKSRVPDYGDLVLVRRQLVEPEKPSYQVFPAQAEHVSNHDYCLHLWTPLGTDPFPDLNGERMGTVGIPGVSHAELKDLLIGAGVTPR